MNDRTHELIFRAIDQTITPQEFDELQDAIQRDPQVCTAYLQAVSLCESLQDIAVESAAAHSSAAAILPTAAVQQTAPSRTTGFRSLQWLAAGLLLVLVAATAFWFGRGDHRPVPRPVAGPEPSGGDRTESRIAGHATLRRAVGIQWPAQGSRRLEGDVLPNGLLAFDAGVAEIDFFCGATLIVEGPAQLQIESDWAVRVDQGRLRAHVPPAARGFVVKAADSEIVDLGTEFALEVGTETAHVEVIDGEVELRGGTWDGQHLVTGQGQSLKGQQTSAEVLAGLSTVSELQQLRRRADEDHFTRWQSHSQQLRQDDRLIVYYPISAGLTGRTVPNAAPSGSEHNGLLVGPVQQTNGRFGQPSTGLEFDRPGARVRTRIDGQFQAFTFSCWVRIDSLEHRYNALFMADSYENGEPHWQIRDDGSLMFSVMVDDTQQIRHFSEIDQQMVTQAGLHHVYYSPPFWNLSRSGQWFHLAAVYNPAERIVQQYVNGKLLSSEEIADKFHVDELYIGPAEIGNWGQPFRETPWFAVRHLNGTIDELAIFNSALTSAEINTLYQEGKPVGY